MNTQKLISVVGCLLIAANGYAVPQAVPAKSVVVKPTKKKSVNTIPVFVRSASNQMAAAIQVKVNGDTVNFASGEPVEADGRILVPMRGVFEALGASVRFNQDSGMIEAMRGETTISLRPGGETATVNGEVRPLDSPVQIVNGAAVVPLRFVSETFGARVSWDADNYEVSVKTDALVAEALPSAPESDAVFGTLTGIYPEAQLLTVRLAGGSNVKVPLTYDVNVTRRIVGEGATPVSSESKPVFGAGALKLGEQVQVELNDKYEGLLILVDANIRRGTLKSVESLSQTGGYQVTLTDGTVIVLAPGAVITYGADRVPLSAVKPAEKVSIRLNDAGQGIALLVTTPANPMAVPAVPNTASTPAKP